MYILLKSDGKSYYLQDGRTYFVGRVDTNIVLDDKAVSRKHAKIVVRNNSVFVEDLASSNKTFVNRVQLKPNVETQADDGNEIKFGNKESIFILQRDRVVVTTSNLSSTEKQSLKNYLDKMKAALATKWSDQCTHIVCDKMVLTEKVLCALISQQMIVNLNYFKDRWKHIESSVALPNFESYRPEIDDKIPNFDYRLDRSKLFKNKTFVFSNDNTKKKMDSIIFAAGGKTISFESNPIAKKDILTAKTEYLFIITDQNSQSDDTNFNRCVNHLMANGKRSIPLQEIAMAVVLANCDVDCNPSFNKVLHVMSGERVAIDKVVLAPETQTQENSEALTLTRKIIPATLESDSPVIIIDDDDENNEDRREATNPQSIDEDITNKGESIVIDDEIDGDKTNKREGEDLQSNNTKKKKMEESDIDLEVNPFKPAPKFQKKTENNLDKQSSQPVKRKSDDVFVSTSKKSKFNFKKPHNESNSSFTNPFTREKPANASKPEVSFLCSTQIEGSQNVDKDLVTSPQLSDSPSPTKNPFTNISNTNRKSGVKNPFANTSANENSARKQIKPAENKLSTTIKETENEIIKKKKNDLLDDLNYSIASTSTGRSVKWLSKATDNDDFVAKEIDEEMREFYKSFNAKINIISEDTLIIRKPMIDLSVNTTTNTTNSTLSNFKKFRKVKPLHEQSVIIPKSRFQKFVCNREDAGRFSSDEEQVAEEQPELVQVVPVVQENKSRKKFKFMA